MEKELIEKVIERFGLEPLDKEGGYFRFVSNFGNGAGLIYYLMTEDSFSHMHSLTQDELWYYLEGDPVEQTVVSEDGTVERTILDKDNRVSIVKAGKFQATRLAIAKLGYCLASTVMSPAYRDDMYTHGADCPWLCRIGEVEDLI